MILLHRENVFDRALSKVVAMATGIYGIKDPDKTEKIVIDLDRYEEEIIRYRKFNTLMLRYLRVNSIPFHYVKFNSIYITNHKLQNYKNLMHDLGLDTTNIPAEKYDVYLNADYKTKQNNKKIVNMDKIMEINKKYQK